MTPEQTGAERYLASRMNNRDYREAYEAAVTGPMNVITLYQPHASLIMAGVKTWETRGNPPNGDMRPEGVRGLPGKRINAGDRILIHAANRPITFADCERFNTIDPLSNVQLGWVDGDPALYFRDDMVETSFEAGAWTSGNTFEISMTFGAILGSVRFEAAIPVRTHVHNPHLPKLDDWSAWICHETDIAKLTYEIDGFPDLDISDQLPFGNWTPGGWAWELADPQPLDQPIPVKGKQGVWEWK